MKDIKYRVRIHLKNDKDITVFLDRDKALQLFDQIYEVFSGNLSDNSIEVISDTEFGNIKETILIRGNEVMYVTSQEHLHE